MQKSLNPAAVRSRKWLTDALLELMKDKPFQEISISEIAEKADLSRRTFYRSFSSKEEIICDHLEAIFHSGVQTLLSEENDHSCFRTIRWYLDLWYDHRDLALLLYRDHLISLLMQEYHTLFREVFLLRKGSYPLENSRKQ